MCWPKTLTPAQWDQVVEQNGALPPGMNPDGLRWFSDTQVWAGDIAIGPSGQAQRVRFTYSFPDDFTTWGLPQAASTGPSNLNQRFGILFGTDNIDLGREYVRQSLAVWHKYAGLDYDEVADDNAPMDQLTTRVPSRGDIRIAGRPFGPATFLAYNAFPTNSFANIGGSDMVLNTSFFRAQNFSDPNDNYRYFRNTVAHEHGHGIAAIHAVPCNDTKLMEPLISVVFDVVQIDERRFAGHNYGDRFSGNQSPADAVDLGDLALPLRSVLEPSLSTNGANGPNNSGEDWFLFALSAPQDVVISVVPIGGVYDAYQQESGCFSGNGSEIDASAAGDLGVELRNADGTVVLASSVSAGPGESETISLTALSIGTYTIRVFDGGPNANQNVQLYDFALHVANVPASPLAIAGINKRVAANTNCFFLGDINSQATEPGAELVGYEWDLDGDGSFETVGAQPMTQYPSNGVYDVSLRVTDSNGQTDTDLITVTVFDATTELSEVTPGRTPRGKTVPIVVRGANLRSVADASEFSVSGDGVAITGTPLVDALGTEVSGLSLEISADAPLGPRDLSVSNPDGSAMLASAITVACPGDLSDDGVVSLADLGVLLGCWGAPCGDLNGDGTTDEIDLTAVLADWNCGR